MKTKDCKTVIYIEEDAEDIYSSSLGANIIQSIEYLSDRFNDSKASAENFKSKFPSS